MRKNMEEINGERKKFIGVFKRFGSKENWHGYPETTVLLADVRNENGEKVTDHIWFSYTKNFKKLGDLKEGDKIEFFARVGEYVKGYVNHRDFIDNRELDYKLNYPTKIRRIENESKKDIQIQTISK